MSNASIPNPVATPASNTIYHVTVTNANSCQSIDSVTINIRPDPVFTLTQPTNICQNKSIQLAASGGTSYSWQPDPSLNNLSIADPVASPQTTTTYSVLITDGVCNNSSTLSTIVTVLPLPIVQATKSTDIDCSNDQSQLAATGAVQYSWSPASSLNNPNISNPMARPTVQTQYVVKGTDNNGCANYDSVTVMIAASNKGGYLMPSAFTPNNDGLNDCYGIRYWGIILDLQFSIYNRWGERVFYSTQPGACWDGKYKGLQQDPGVFIYMIKAKTSCENYVFRKGTFALIR